MVKQLNKGADGLIHSAEIRTSTGRIDQPIARLYPLEVTGAEMSSTDGESTRKEPASTADQESQSRPVWDATVRERHKVQQWTNTLQSPWTPGGYHAYGLVNIKSYYTIVEYNSICMI